MSAPENIRRSSGVALIIVLVCVVMLTVLIVGFMATSRNSMSIAVQGAAQEESRAMSELALDLVMGQIRDATRSCTGTNAWASQPGAIRVWNQNGGLRQSGDPNGGPGVYKLYSASVMQANDINFLNPSDATADVPDNWATLTSRYVDLNTPVKNADGTWIYPVLNPTTIGAVNGFTSTEPSTPSGTSTPWPSSAAMPVQWLYVLKNGMLVAPDATGTSATIATFSGSQQPTAANPIVGRVAFWTDDESCKVNINTAGGTTIPTAIGLQDSDSYWDVPVTKFDQEYNFGRSTMVQGEYQRYPGHPATVNLLSVFLSGTSKSLTSGTTLAYLANLFALTPRYAWGGSKNGTVAYSSSPTALTGSNAATNRLYASVDELQFSGTGPSLATGSNRAATTVLPGTLGSGTFANVQQMLDASRFFLTAHSRASDLNLFGRPRVSIWPVSAINSGTTRTAFDQLTAFCSTLGGTGANTKPYFFQRYDPLSATHDWNGPGIPVGASGASRNFELFGYLENLTKIPIPGYGTGTFLDKYDNQDGSATGEWDQILAEIFDYIRCVHLTETWNGVPAGYKNYTPAIITPGVNDVNMKNYPGAGFVIPISITTPAGNPARGAGRAPTISEVALMMMQRASTSGSSTPSNQLQTGFVFETFSPMHGFMPWVAPPVGSGTIPAFNLNVTMPSPVQVTGIGGVNYPIFNSGTSTFLTSELPAFAEGGTEGDWLIPIWNTGFPYPYCRIAGTGTNIGNAIPIPSGTSTVSVVGGSLQITLGAGGTNYQSLSLNFPSAAQMPVPTPDQYAPTTAPGTAALQEWNRRYINNQVFYLKSGDVVQSIISRDGDYRTMACLGSVPSGFFMPHSGFGGQTASGVAAQPPYMAHSLMRVERLTLYGAALGGFVSGANYEDKVITGVTAPAGSILGTGTFNSAGNTGPVYGTTRPKIDPGITDLISQGWTGDWENGVGTYPDGAYLNKSDEGDLSLAGVCYFSEGSWSNALGFFSPNREMPSAGMFGALPTGVIHTYNAYSAGNYASGRPWRTLLFCPDPDIASSPTKTAGAAHFGFGSPLPSSGGVIPSGNQVVPSSPGFIAPPDRLLLDLFTMPIVEPYAISDPFSTAGRINMNAQIVPFTGITRETGLWAVLSSQRVPAISGTSGAIYKDDLASSNNTVTRMPVNIPETLKQFDNVFAPGGQPQNGDIFHSATDICGLYLVPTAPVGISPTLATVPSWWSGYRLTGDNLRERPYTYMYPLLTTKSNVYTVHIWAQSLKKIPGTSPSSFVQGQDQVRSEYRGRVTFERYLDPNDSRFSDGSVNPDTTSLESLYRYRVIENKQFMP